MIYWGFFLVCVSFIGERYKKINKLVWKLSRLSYIINTNTSPDTYVKTAVYSPFSLSNYYCHRGKNAAIYYNVH